MTVCDVGLCEFMCMSVNVCLSVSVCELLCVWVCVCVGDADSLFSQEGLMLRRKDNCGDAYGGSQGRGAGGRRDSAPQEEEAMSGTERATRISCRDVLADSNGG